MPLIPLWAAHMNSMSEALLSFHSPSKLLRIYIFSKASTFWPLPPLLGWVLVAAELEGDFEAVGGEIVEVLHPTAHWVPEAIYLDCVKRNNSEIKKDKNLKRKSTEYWGNLLGLFQNKEQQNEEGVKIEKKNYQVLRQFNWIVSKERNAIWKSKKNC